MPLAPGTRLGNYEIVSALGAGGMGEVYKARDIRLNRVVAIKVLPGGLDVSPELTRRFEREAQAIAALNHPNICTVHDVADEGSSPYFVMEYLEGETLAARLSRGALPLQQALQHAVGLADALDKAHAAGVVHRDLKPANIMLTKSGAKLLDFGLVKLVPGCAGGGALETVTAPVDLTRKGTIVGTLQYMAPEQIEGMETDARTDIFALGAVIYEMVTGTKAFIGTSRTSLMVSILEHDPAPMSTLQRLTPPGLDRLVAVCLAKSPGDRWQSARDLTLQLEGIAALPIAPASGIPRRSYRERIAWSVTALSILGLIASGVQDSAESPKIVFGIPPPENSVSRMPLDPFTTVSPDGRHIAFTTDESGRGPGRLWVQSLDSDEARFLPGTEGAFIPFWSPDSREIGFFTARGAGELKVVSYEGGPVRLLCNAVAPLGGTWNPNGIILFSTGSTSSYQSGSVPVSGLHRVSAAGGISTPISVLDRSGSNSRSRRYGGLEAWPHFLPDGRHFLYLERTSMMIHAGALDSSDSRPLLAADSQAIYAPPGYLLFVRQGTLMGHAFDAGRLELRGDAFRIAEDVRSEVSLGGAVFSASNNGMLAYSTGVFHGPSRAAWFDRSGQPLGAIDQGTTNRRSQLSPDGSRLLQERLTAGGLSDIWMRNLERGNDLPLASKPADEESPIWSPDGAQIVYASNQKGTFDLYRIAATGSGTEESLYESSQDKHPSDWSSDGRYIALTVDDATTRRDIWVMDLNAGGDPVPVVHTMASEDQPRFSPDGKWIAYRSNLTLRHEIYIQPFPAGNPVPMSVNGGSAPFWRHDGHELFFLSPDNWLMAVDVKPGGGVPRRVFELPPNCGEDWCIDAAVTRDGRFLLVTAEAAPEVPMRVLVNWTSGLNRLGRFAR